MNKETLDRIKMLMQIIERDQFATPSDRWQVTQEAAQHTKALVIEVETLRESLRLGHCCCKQKAVVEALNNAGAIR